MVRWLKRIALGLLALLVLAQLVPYGRAHDNPAVGVEPTWPSPRVKELARRACFDCHSHETVWPWYSHVAPISWLVQHDVDEGRRELNFSAWDRSKEGTRDAAEELEEGEMPPAAYLPLHPDAKLSDAERKELLDGFRAMADQRPGGRKRRGGGGDGEHREGDEHR